MTALVWPHSLFAPCLTILRLVRGGWSESVGLLPEGTAKNGNGGAERNLRFLHRRL